MTGQGLPDPSKGVMADPTRFRVVVDSNGYVLLSDKMIDQITDKIVEKLIKREEEAAAELIKIYENPAPVLSQVKMDIGFKIKEKEEEE